MMTAGYYHLTFLFENKETFLILLSIEFVQRVLKVKLVFDHHSYGKGIVLDKSTDIFSYFSIEALLMSTHNICFSGEIRKIYCGCPLYLVQWVLQICIRMHVVCSLSRSILLSNLLYFTQNIGTP